MKRQESESYLRLHPQLTRELFRFRYHGKRIPYTYLSAVTDLGGKQLYLALLRVQRNKFV